MKPLQSFLTLAIAFLFTGFCFGQQTVTLICNPNAIDESGPTGACYFLGGEGVNPVEFTTYASVDEVITWVGQATTDEDSIDVFMIKYQGGTNVFNSNELGGERSVQGRIQNATPEDSPYKYEIRFKVNSTGKLYKIDPLIRTR